MRKSEYPFFADWFAISLRWLVLVGVAYSLVLASKFDYYLAGAVLAGILWNVFNTLLAIFNRRIKGHRILNVFFDFAGTTMLFFFSEGFFGPLSWVGLLNLFSAGIYYGWPGSLILSFLISVMQIGGSILVFETQITGQNMALLASFNLISGLLFGLLSMQFYSHLRDHFHGLREGRSSSDDNLRTSERLRLQKLFRMIEALNYSLNYKTVLQTALDLCGQVLAQTAKNPENLVSAILLFDGEKLKVMDARGFPGADFRMVFPAEQGALNQVVQERDIILLHNPHEDEELGKLLGVQNCKSALLLPLTRGLDSYGLMLFAHQDKDYFNRERQDLLEVISHQAAIAIQNAQLFHDLEAERDRLVRSQEEERKQLARELHDGPTQSVSGIAMRAEYIRRLMDKRMEKAELAKELEQIEGLARKTTQEIRHMLFSLRPLVLEKEGLLNALETLAQKMLEVYQQNLNIDVNEAVAAQLGEKEQKVIFQITEEAVNNARKHAEASLIRVRLHAMPRNAELALLEIADNGVGFNLKEVKDTYDARGSLGMVNLHERTELINGRLNIESSPGKGTRVQVAIPLTDKAADWLHSGAGTKAS